MNTQPLRTSLRCLVHPATLLSIGLLLLNDHLLKAIAPSWITGKVSDFAGVFFFPFLLAAGLSVFLGPLRRFTPMMIGRMAFSITAAWFTMAKATPLGHALTVQVVSAMVGHEVSVIMDPTDLIAVVMLWPAWRLWCREAVKADRRFSIRAGWLALALATIATVATSPPPHPQEVLRVVIVDAEMYAMTWSDGDRRLAYKTSDNGRSWSTLERSVPESLENVGRPSEEVIVSDPHNPRILYRVKREERVEYSEDGGSTWRVVWQVPAGRRQFMDRLWNNRLYPIDMGPYDLAFTPDGSGTLVVAMGTEGVLVRDHSGTWSRYAVGTSRPIPFSRLNPGAVLSILWFPEGVVLYPSVLLVSVVLSILGWVPMVRAIKREHGGHKVVWIVRPFLVFVIGFLLAIIAGGYIFLRVDVSIPTFLLQPLSVLGFLTPVWFPELLLLILLVTWSRAISLATDRESAGRSRRGCVWTTLGLVLAAGLPFVLWVAGIVPWYNVALASAIVLGIAVVGVGATSIYRHSRAAVGQDERGVPASNAR